MVLSAPGSRRHRAACPSDRRSRGPRQHVRPSLLVVTAQINQICLSCRLQRPSFQWLLSFAGNDRCPSGKAMDYGVHLAKRHLGDVDLDVWVRAEQLEGSGHGVQMYSSGRRDGHDRGGMARGTGGKVGFSCCGDRCSGDNWVSIGLIVWYHRKKRNNTTIHGR